MVSPRPSRRMEHVVNQIAAKQPLNQIASKQPLQRLRLHTACNVRPALLNQRLLLLLVSSLYIPNIIWKGMFLKGPRRLRPQGLPVVHLSMITSHHVITSRNNFCCFQCTATANFVLGTTVFFACKLRTGTLTRRGHSHLIHIWFKYMHTTPRIWSAIYWLYTPCMCVSPFTFFSFAFSSCRFLVFHRDAQCAERLLSGRVYKCIYVCVYIKS